MKSGFTLVEVLVVLLLIGILTTLAALRIESNPNTAVSEEADRLQQVLSAGADRARASRQPVVWQADGSGYALVSGDGGPQREIDRHRLGAPVRILAVWYDGALQAPPYRLVLAARGSGLFRIRLGADQARPLELQSTALGRIERVGSD